MSDKFLLWGFKPSYGRRWIKLAGGSLRGCTQLQLQRQAEGGWNLAILPAPGRLFGMLEPAAHPEQFNRIPNARFWIFGPNSSPVKVTLKPGESVCMESGGKTEEGYSRQYEFFTHRGDHVSNEWHQEGRDCDGYVESNGCSVCRIDQLRSIPTDESFPYFPRDNWVRGDVEIYDEAAQLAGY